MPIPDEVREAIDRLSASYIARLDSDTLVKVREELERAIQRAMLMARAAAFESCHHPETAREIRAQAAALDGEKS